MVPGGKGCSGDWFPDSATQALRSNWGHDPATNDQLFLELSTELGIVQWYWFFRYAKYKISGVTWACIRFREKSGWAGNMRKGQIPYRKPLRSRSMKWWLMKSRNIGYHLSKLPSTEWSQTKRDTMCTAGHRHFRVKMPKLIGSHLMTSCVLDARHETIGFDVRPAGFLLVLDQIFSYCPFLLEWECILYMLLCIRSM